MSDAGSVVPSSNDIKTVASLFWMTQGNFRVNPGVMRVANSSFRPIRYVHTWETSDMQSVETSPLRTDTLGYLAGSLAADATPTTSTFVISVAKTKWTAPPFSASTPGSGDISTSCSNFVSWVRVGDELAKVTAVSPLDSSSQTFSVKVLRGFSNTTSRAHAAGDSVFAPVYNALMPPNAPQCARQGGSSPLVYQVNPVGLGRTGVTMLVEQTVLSVQQLNYSGSWYDCFASATFQAVTGSGEPLFVARSLPSTRGVWDVSASPPVPFSSETYHTAEAQRLAAVQAALVPLLGQAGRDYFIYANNLEVNLYADGSGSDARFLMSGQHVPAWPGNNTLVSYEPLAGYCNEAYALHETGDCQFAVVDYLSREQLVKNALMVSDLSSRRLASMPMAAQAGCKSPALERISFDGRDQYEQFAYGAYLLAIARSLQDGETTSFGLPVLYWRNTTSPNGTVITSKYAHVHDRYSYGIGSPQWPVAPVTNESQWQLWPQSHPQLLGRRFSNGLVLLNPAESPAALGVRLNKTMLDPDKAWEPVTTVDVINGTAKILLLSKPQSTR